MKKIILNIIITITAVLLFISCETLAVDPVASLVTTINLSAPTSETQIKLDANLLNSEAIKVVYSSADFGYAAAINYSLEIDSINGNFDKPQTITLGNFNDVSTNIHEFVINHKKLNLTLNVLNKNEFNILNSFKIRVVGKPVGQMATSTNGLKAISEETVLKAITYDPLDETQKLFVPGNFGAASTFADWDFNDQGSGNSPVIYTAANDGKYSGFVWMNTSIPEFQFANPGPADQKGKNAAIAGGLIANGTNIVVPAGTATTSGPGTYYLTANWILNTYTVNKTKVALSGAAMNNTTVDLDFVTDASSPYYRMYTKAVTLKLGALKVLVSANGTSNLGVASGQNANLTQQTPNKLKLGALAYTNILPGNFLIVLDIKNAANYNLRVFPN